MKVAFEALNLTEFFYCQASSAQTPGSSLNLHAPLNGCGFRGCDDKNDGGNTDCIDNNGDISQEDTCGSSDTSTSGIAEDVATNNGSTTVKPPKLQKGVLRTNCIDCLDRTNVAQYAYGLASLGRQLHALGSVESPELDLDSPLAHHLMHFYERMGDTLALQYGGSAAHNKIFSAKRGHLKFAIQSQEFFRTLQRYYSNAYMDAYKQAAINLFLGYHRPQQEKFAPWESESVAGENVLDDKTSQLIKRSRSDGSILRKSNTSLSSNGPNGISTPGFSDFKNELQPPSCRSGSVHDAVSKLSYTPTVPHIKYTSCELDYGNFSGDSNFLDLDWLSASDNGSLSRPRAVSTPNVNDNGARGVTPGITEGDLAEIHAQGLSHNFLQWVDEGEAFWY
ncbi:hypothetical protein ACQJBY_070947 [Aegilops geniculata]